MGALFVGKGSSEGLCFTKTSEWATGPQLETASICRVQEGFSNAPAESTRHCHLDFAQAAF